MIGYSLVWLRFCFFGQVLASSKQSGAAMAASSSGKVDATARLAVLKTRLFRAVCRRVCKGLLNKDRLLFAVRLAQVTAKRANGEEMCLSESARVLCHFC